MVLSSHTNAGSSPNYSTSNPAPCLWLQVLGPLHPGNVAWLAKWNILSKVSNYTSKASSNVWRCTSKCCQYHPFSRDSILECCWATYTNLLSPWHSSWKSSVMQSEEVSAWMSGVRDTPMTKHLPFWDLLSSTPTRVHSASTKPCTRSLRVAQTPYQTH